ncbi:MAG: DUF481 domain-containing protein [Verrucomicrobiales bacterium]|nr:DUF481 domain-containing protein [Verrucomicrobiales bacterium]
MNLKRRPAGRARMTRDLAMLATACVAVNAAEDAAAPEGAEAPKPASSWKTSAAIGATLTRGNSDTLTVNGTIDTIKKWGKNEAGAGFSVTYGETDNKETANNMAAYGQYNRLVSERLFVYGRVDFSRDKLADVNYRIGLSPGAGYYFIKNDKFTLSGELGPGYIWEEVGGVSDDYFSLHVGEKFTWEINDRARLWQSLSYDPEVEDFENYLLRAEIGFETDIMKNLSLRVVGIDTYRNMPAAGRNKNDFQLITGIAYKF